MFRLTNMLMCFTKLRVKIMKIVIWNAIQMVLKSLVTFSKFHGFWIHHYEKDTLVFTAQSLFFISEIKSPKSEVPQDRCEQIRSQVTGSRIPQVGFSLAVWFLVERQPSGHIADFYTNHFQLFYVFSLLITAGNTSAVLKRLTPLGWVVTALIDFSSNVMWQHKTAQRWRHQKFASRPFFAFPRKAIPTRMLFKGIAWHSSAGGSATEGFAACRCSHRKN